VGIWVAGVGSRLRKWYLEDRTTTICLAICTVPPEGKERVGVYCVSSCKNLGTVIGSVVLDSLEIMNDMNHIEITFVIVSSRPEALDVGTFAGQAFHNVLAVQSKGDACRRVGHGRILEKHLEPADWLWVQ